MAVASAQATRQPRSVGFLGWLVGAQSRMQTRQAIWGYIFLLPWVLGLGIFLTALTVFVLRRSLSQTITTDVENFMMLEASLLRGNKSHEYYLKLNEFRRAARKLDDLPSVGNMERERDDDPDSVNLNMNSMGLEPMYMDESAVAVEELDDSAAEAFNQPQTSEQPVMQNAPQQVSAQPQAAPAAAPAAPAKTSFRVR